VRLLRAFVVGIVFASGLVGLTQPAPAAAAAAPAAASTTTQPDGGAAGDVGSAKRLAAKTGQPVEVLSARDENSSTFANPDGTLTTNFATQPVHVKAGSQWVDVDTTLVSDASGVHPKAVPSALTLSPGGTDELASSARAEDVLGARWLSKLPTPTLSGSTATYPNVLSNVDLQVTATRVGFEVSVVLRAKPANPKAVYRLPLKLGRGVTATADTASGKIVLKAAGGREVGVVEPTTMFDAQRDEAGQPTNTASIKTTVVTNADGSQELNFAPEQNFLTSASTRYPVTIDPSYHLGQLDDTWIANNGTGGGSSSQELRVGYYNGTSAVHRSFMRFDTSRLKGATVSAATLALYQWAAGSCTAKESRIYALAGSFSDTTTWSTQPATYPAIEASSTDVHGVTGCAANWDRWNLTNLAQEWANGTRPNNGFLIRSAFESDTGAWWRFYGMNYPNGSYLPSLAVTYNHTPNLPASVLPSAQSYITNPNQQMTAVVSDPDGGTVQTSWYVVDTTTSGVVINGGLSAPVPSGSTASYGLAGRLTDGHAYSIKARACDGALCSAWTTATTSTADFTAPNTPSISSSTYAANSWHTSGGSGTFTLTDTSTDVDHYLYGLDETAGTTTGSSLTINPMPGGWHVLTVRAVDHAGQLSPATSYQFGADPAFMAVKDGDTSAGLIDLSAVAATGHTGVTINYRRSDTEPWTVLPTGDVTQGGTSISSWPLTAAISTVAGTSPAVADNVTPANLVWNAASTLTGQDSPVQLQVCFDTDCSANAVHVTVDQQQQGSGFAAAAVGPGSLNLYTGDLAVSAQDVSISTPTSDLSVSRTFDTRYPTTPSDGMFGPGWTGSLPVQSANTDWTQLSDTGAAVSLIASDGSTTSFAKTASGYTPTGNAKDSGDTLTAGTAGTYGPSSYLFADLSGTQVTFTPQGSFSAAASLSNPHAYLVSLVTQPGSAQTTSYTYVSGLLTQVLDPIPDGATCTNPGSVSTWTAGCRALTLTYNGSNHVTAVTFVSNTGTSVLSVDMACYSYTTSGQLASAWDPRTGTAGSGSHPVTCGTPTLATGYTYDGWGRLATITPPGLAPWTLGYDGSGRLTTASRTHNATYGGGTETTAVTYNVPLSPDGTHPEYRPDLTAATAASWAQTDVPATATVVYPPGSSVSSTDLRDGQIHYMDSNGQEVNTAAYSGSGAAGWHITTSEYDTTGNVVRTLSAANREEALNPTSGAGAALELPGDTGAAALALSDQSIYTTAPDGVDNLTDEYGPYHLVTLNDGTAIHARKHTHYSYDTGDETGHPSGGSLHLVTSQTTGASASITPVSISEQDVRRTDKAYALSISDATGWTFSRPMKVTEDPGGLARTTITRYDANTGAVIESRTPSNSSGGGAGSSRSIYYTVGINSQDAACGNKPGWAGLLCETAPAAQPGIAGLPGLVTKRTSSYDYLDRPTQQDDMVTDAAGTQQVRGTTTSYLNSGYADRISQVTINGGTGTAVPMQTTSYDPMTGLQTTVSASATTENPATSATSGYDDFGRVISYKDADEATGVGANVTTTTYDSAGRPHQLSDAHTTYTISYNQGGEHRGLPTTVAVTVNSSPTYNGLFTASYNGNMNPVFVMDPNGIQTSYGYDEVGQTLSQKSINLSDGSSWLVDTATASIDRQWRSESNAAGTHSYAYDKVGRLAHASGTPSLDTCSTNTYIYDANSNRTAGTSYPAAADGSCQTSGSGTTIIHSYDGADRIQPTGSDAGLQYDAFGRITNLPAGDASGATLTNAFYATDLVRSQSQNGTSQCWTLDASRRLKQDNGYSATACGGTVTTTVTNHYDDPTTDAPAWIAENAGASQWTANVTGFIGLGVTVGQDGTATYQYANLHGDIIATANNSSNPTISADYDEFGNAVPSENQRYGWLGQQQRSGEARGGSLLMGLRLYQPSLGRFLQTDPFTAGGDNAYDYAHQDPINMADLNGTYYYRWEPVGFGACYGWCKGILRDSGNVNGFHWLPFKATVRVALTCTTNSIFGCDFRVVFQNPYVHFQQRWAAWNWQTHYFYYVLAAHDTATFQWQSYGVFYLSGYTPYPTTFFVQMWRLMAYR
jgi:RHS repeat-associated protein